MGAAGLEYKNTFLTYPELVAARGPTGSSDAFPFGQMPVLVMPDGSVMTQSVALARSVGGHSSINIPKLS